MANSKGSTNVRNLMYPGKHALLPPKSPFPSVAPSYSDYILTPAATAIGPKAVQKPRDLNPNPNHQHHQHQHHHQRTSSESVIAEEQPSWLDDLLDEPDTPVRKPGHRRSTSDSFAYVEQQQQHHAVDYSLAQDDYNYKYRNVISPSPAAAAPHQHHQLSWGSQEFDHQRDLRHWETNLARQKNRVWDHPGGIGSAKDGIVRQGSGSFSIMAHELDGIPSTASEKFDGGEIGALDQNSYDKGLGNRPSSSDTDTKRAKQQFAQRSRVRKLQYIAELERNVQSLQSEGSEVSAELEFLNQQNLILSMENKALKQRLESLAQEHLIKHLEHEVLEREIGRLRTLYQQQLQPQAPPPSSHRRSNSRDLDSQFSNLSLKHKDSNPGQLRI